MHFRTRTVILFTAVTCALAFAWPRLSSKNALFRGRSASDWVRDALDHGHWQQTRAARDVVISELRERAVPLIIAELEDECHSHVFYAIQTRLLTLQIYLPNRLWFLKEPNPAGKISAAAYVLREMGEPASPAAEVLARTLSQSAMHAWESQDVMTALISMGPVAKGALPHLRKLAANKKSWQSAQAAFALYTIDGDTNTLAQVVREKLQAGKFGDLDRELFWFRGDEDLNRWLLPLLCGAVLDPDHSTWEREEIAFYLGETLLTNPLPRVTLESLAENGMEEGLRAKVKEGLDKLGNLDKGEAEH